MVWAVSAHWASVVSTPISGSRDSHETPSYLVDSRYFRKKGRPRQVKSGNRSSRKDRDKSQKHVTLALGPSPVRLHTHSAT